MKRSSRYNAIWVILLIVVSIIAFLLPIQRTDTFWISYAFVVLAIIAQCLINGRIVKHSASLRSRVYGWPIMRVGYIYLGVILCCAVIFTALSNAILSFPFQLPIAVYALVTGLAGIGLIATSDARDYVERAELKAQASVSFMRQLANEALE